jgi:hypothetical protein
MTLLFDGFEQFSRTERVNQLLQLAGYKFVGTPTVAAGRKGGNSLVLFHAYLEREWTVKAGILTHGFAMKSDGRGAIYAIYLPGNSAPQYVVSVDKTTGLVMSGPVGTAAQPGYASPIIGRWYYFEFEIDFNNSQIRMYINGKLDSTTTMPAPMVNAMVLKLRMSAYETVNDDNVTRSLDDMYITDAARLGPMQVTTRFPTATPKDEWSIQGAPSAHAAVSPPIDMLEKYIYSGTADAEDQFTSSTQLPDTAPIRHVQLMTLYRKATSDPMSLEINLGGDKTTLTNIPRDWTFQYTPMSADGLDAGNIAGTEFGVKLKL